MIREWNEADLSEILILLDQLNEAQDENQELDIGNIQRLYQSMIALPEVYHNAIFEDGGVIIGFVSVVFYQSIYHKVGTALINELVVSDSHRNQGIGKALLNYVIELAKAKGMDEIEIGVMKDNTKAISFYKACGIDKEYLLLGMEF